MGTLPVFKLQLGTPRDAKTGSVPIANRRRRNPLGNAQAKERQVNKERLMVSGERLGISS